MEKLERILNFFENFDYNLKESFPDNESQILCKDFYFLNYQWQITRTEFKVAKIDSSLFFDELLSQIKRLEKAYNRGCDWIEIDSQLIRIYHLLQNKYIALRGDEYGALYQRQKDARAKGGYTTTSIFDEQREIAETTYVKYKKEYPELLTLYNQSKKKRKPNTPITQLKEMIRDATDRKMSDDTYLRWAKELLRTDGHLKKTQH